MTTRMRLVVVLSLLTMGCEIGGPPASFVVPGPTVPSPLPTTPPYVWDTREELAIWVENPVARGSLALEGSGPDAFIRIDRADLAWVLRGPDLTPAATGVRSLLIRYRWQPDPGLPSTASRVAYVTASFEIKTPAPSSDPTEQGAALLSLQPHTDWTEVTFAPSGPTRPPFDVAYCYVHSLGANLGVIEIDRIQLVR